MAVNTITLQTLKHLIILEVFLNIGVTTAEQTEIVTEHNNYRRATDAKDMTMMVSDYNLSV